MAGGIASSYLFQAFFLMIMEKVWLLFCLIAEVVSLPFLLLFVLFLSVMDKSAEVIDSVIDMLEWWWSDVVSIAKRLFQ